MTRPDREMAVWQPEQAPHWSEGMNTVQAVAHFARSVLRMPRRANDNNPNMPVYEG